MYWKDLIPVFDYKNHLLNQTDYFVHKTVQALGLKISDIQIQIRLIRLIIMQKQKKKPHTTGVFTLNE